MAQVVINEVSCSNISIIQDSFGENEDFVELLNVGTTDIDLTGFYLSDNPNNFSKWQIPSGTILAGQKMMVYCSGRNTVVGNELHPNFKLTQTKPEWFILSGPGGNVGDSVALVNKITKENHSFGRSTDGAADWKLFTNPTPNAPNSGAQNFYMKRPSFSLPPGFYNGAQMVTITAPAGQIRYTLDGSEPSAASTLYSGPINIASTTVLRAKVFGANEPSIIKTSTYFIDESHAVPVVSVAGTGVDQLIAQGNGGSFEPTGSFELFEEDQSYIDGALGSFNKHGNDSWAYAQRGFDYIVRDEFGDANRIEHQIFPEKARDDFKRLILKPGANDNYPFENGAHIRDAFVQTLSQKADLRLDERTWRPCVLYLNGEYWGVYELREKYDDHHFTEHYYNQAERFGENQDGLHYLKTWGATWEEYGAPNAQPAWDNLRNYIMTNDMSVQSNFNYVDSLYNWRSLVDYFVLNSFIVSQDWLNWNTAWWRGRNPAETKKKWRYTLWDMDASFGHYINYTGVPQTGPDADPCNAESLPNPGGQGHTEILTKLLAESDTVEQFYISRYIDLNNTYLNCNYAISILDSMLNTFSAEMPAQINKWGGSIGGYNTAVQDLKDFINDRCVEIDSGLIDCYNLTGPYDFEVDIDPIGAGEVQVNSIWVPGFPWIAQYFGNIEINLNAVANPGYEFSHWEYDVGPLFYNDTLNINKIMIASNESIVAVFEEVVIPDDPDDPDNPDDPDDPDDDGEVYYSSHSVNIPNAFSPNNDGHNDYLRPIVGDNVQNFTLSIYDRWGNLVYETSSKSAKWDGTYKGNKMNTGVFAYSLDIVYYDGIKENKSGNITLIR